MKRTSAESTYLGDGRASSRRWIEGSLIVGFWTFIFVLTVGQRALDPRDPEGLSNAEALHSGLEYGIWLILTPIIFWLARRFSLERKDLARHLSLHAAVAVAVVIAMNALTSWTFLTWVAEGTRGPFSFARSVLSLRFLDELIIYLVILSAGFARDYFLRYRERLTETVQLRTEAARLHAQLADARLQTLRMQINPHFLFNTLHAVSTLVERDPAGVRRMIARLSELLRYTLDGVNADEVPLEQELNFLNGYLEIQRIRFQGRLDVRKEIEPDVLDALVPNLILQPLVENAIKHGVSQINETGRVVVRAWREGVNLNLIVSDNGPGPGSSSGDGFAEVSDGVGLRNTRERLESLYGAAQRLAIVRADSGGLEARITLPYHTPSDLRATAVAK